MVPTNTFSVLYGTEGVAKLAKPKSECSICLTYAIIALNSWGGLILGHYSCVYIAKWTINQLKVEKNLQAHVGMKCSRTNWRRYEWHHNTFTPSLHLVVFCQPLHVLITWVHRRSVSYMENCKVSSAYSVVHVVVHGEWVICAISFLLNMADMVCLVCLRMCN